MMNISVLEMANDYADICSLSYSLSFPRKIRHYSEKIRHSRENGNPAKLTTSTKQIILHDHKHLRLKLN
jgi:hypothetical protein